MTATKENSDELTARRWLELQGHSDIRRLQNDPPDYVVEGRYAVEVRRLNWMTETDDGTRGVEEYEKPLEGTLECVLKEYDQSPVGYTIFVDVDYPFEPPTPDKEVVEREVRHSLDDVVRKILGSPDLAAPSQPAERCLKCGLHLWFTPMWTDEPTGFVLNDIEVATASRGWVVSDAIDNIPCCIEDKTHKVMKKNKVGDYPEWWLALVDHILLTPIRETEMNKIRVAVPNRAFWSKIVVINRMDPGCFTEI